MNRENYSSLINNRIAPSSLGNRASEVGSNGWDRQFGAIGESWYAGIHPPGSPGSKKRINGFCRLSLFDQTFADGNFLASHYNRLVGSWIEGGRRVAPNRPSMNIISGFWNANRNTKILSLLIISNQIRFETVLII